MNIKVHGNTPGFEWGICRMDGQILLKNQTIFSMRLDALIHPGYANAVYI